MAGKRHVGDSGRRARAQVLTDLWRAAGNNEGSPSIGNLLSARFILEYGS